MDQAAGGERTPKLPHPVRADREQVGDLLHGEERMAAEKVEHLVLLPHAHARVPSTVPWHLGMTSTARDTSGPQQGAHLLPVQQPDRPGRQPCALREALHEL